jgi:hypothetical protein
LSVSSPDISLNLSGLNFDFSLVLLLFRGFRQAHRKDTIPEGCRNLAEVNGLRHAEYPLESAVAPL